MRTVFSSMEEVAHIWAHRLQDEARSGNIFVDGESIYSYGYHFEIARWVLPLNSPERMVIYNTETRSNSTSRHQSLVRTALDNDTVILRVPDKGYMFDTCENDDGSVHLTSSGFDSLAHLFMYDAGRILDYAHKQKRARTTDYRYHIMSVINNMRIAFSSFRLYEKRTFQVVAVAPLLDYINEDNPKYNAWSYPTMFPYLYGMDGTSSSYSPYVGKCIKEGQRLAVKRNVWVVNALRDLGVFDYSEELGFSVELTRDLLTEIIERLLSEEGEVVEDLKSRLQKLEKKNAKEKKRLEEIAMRQRAEKVAEWRAGSRIHSSDLRDLPYVILRLIERDGQQLVETSKGIRLTIDECKRLWGFWKSIVKKGVEFRHELVLDANGHKWTVNSVDDKGTLKAGCHIIEFSEGLEMAKKLNFDIN